MLEADGLVAGLVVCPHRDHRLVQDVAGVDGDAHANTHGNLGHEEARLAVFVAGGQLEYYGGERLLVGALGNHVLVARVFAAVVLQRHSGVVDDRTWLLLHERRDVVHVGNEGLELSGYLAIETLVQSCVGGHRDRDSEMAVQSLRLRVSQLEERRRRYICCEGHGLENGAAR